MKISPYQKARKKKLEEKAITLYKTGLSTREVGKALTRSHTWVWNIVKELVAEEELSTSRIDES